MKYAISRSFVSIALAVIAIFSLSLPSRAAIVSYNYSAGVSADCIVGPPVTPCFAQGMFDLNSDFFSSTQNILNPMFELVTTGGDVLDSFSGPFSGGATALTSATGDIIRLAAPEFEFGVRQLFLQDDLASWTFTNPGGFGRTYESFEILITPKVIPLPAALPLYGSAMAIIGFIGWYRRRRQAGA